MGGGGSKSKIHESSQATERVRAQEQARVRMAQEKEATERSRLKYQEQERIRQMKQQQYNKAHQMKMQQMKDDRARQEREAAALNEKRRREHDARMKQMQIEKEERDKQRKKQLLTARINSCNDEISKLGTMITNDTNQLKKDKPVLEKVSQDLKVVEKWVENFRDHKNTKLDNYAGNIRLAEAKDEFDKADFMVQKHIDKTGQIESKVGEFLDLFSLLVKATISTTAQSNILDAEISTMGELIRKECQDQLSIDNYFNQKNLTRFIPILADEGFVNVNALICESDEEYDEILQLLEKGIQKQIELGQNKMENNQEEKQEEEKEEISGEILAKELLTKWRLIKYWDVIQDEGFEDPKYWKEITDNDLNEMGFKRGHRIKFKAEIKEWISGNKILTTMEKRLLNEICFKHESWQRYEKEQADAVKEGLDDISSLLGEFFMRIHTAIKQSRAILNYEIDLNDQQRKAIKMVNNLPPAIEYKDNNIINDIDEYDVKDNDEFIQPDICDDIRKEWIINSKCEIYSESHKQWCDGVIIDITNDDEGEWLQVKYCVNNRLYKTKEIQRSSQGIRVSMYNMDKNKKLALQCRALTTASLISIDVTDSMMNKFNTNVLTTRALAVARGVEDCCMQMIQAQSTIRQSVLLSQEVLKHKPAYMSGEAERLWKAACDGSKRIVKTAITMIRVSAQYFGFFLRFQQSFKFYQSRKHCSLLVSLEHLHKDVREFTQFQHNFAKHVQELSKEAMDCIQNCIESGAGAENFENWRNKRDITLQTYQNKKAQYDKKSLELDHQFDVEQQKRINLCAEKEKFDYKVKTLETAIINNNDYKQKYLNAKSQLESMLVNI